MFVRTGGSGDLPAVSRLIADSLHASHDALYGADAVSLIASALYSVAVLGQTIDRPRSEFLVADDGDAIAGAAFASASDAEGRVVDLLALFVRPDATGRGIGGMLLSEIEGSFFESERIRLEIDDRNLRGRGFFAGEGYEPLSERRDDALGATLLTLGKSLA